MNGNYCPLNQKGIIERSLLTLALLGGLWIGLTGYSTPALGEQTPKPRQSALKSQQIVDADLIRVGLSNNGMQDMEYRSARLTATGSYTVTDRATGKVVWQAGGGQPAVFSVSGRGFVVNGRGPFRGPMVLSPINRVSKVRALSITRRKRFPSYKGVFEIVRGFSAPNKLTVVNVLPLQEYLKAVVPNELPARYGYEAVKAQSVAARNYAIRPREKPWPTFDICDSQYCQVYFGAHTEHPTTNKALRETHGLIALQEGNPILALYSSAHGGYSENYENSFADPMTKAFPGTALPYLTGIADIPDAARKFGRLDTEAGARAFWMATNIPSYDVNSPYNRWEKHWSRNTIQATLNRYLLEVSKDTSTRRYIKPLFKAGQSIGELKRIHVKRRGVSGKAMVLEIEATGGRWTLEKEFVIRKVFRHNGRMLPSANVVFSHMTGANERLISLKANGGGFGHGVGMSQLGASWMSGKGFSFDRIIQHYYRGVAIGTIPLLVGKNHPGEAARVTFFSKKPAGRLWVESNLPGAEAHLTLNGTPMTVSLGQEKQIWQDVGASLNGSSENTLILYPDSENPDRKLKAWIELIAARPEDVPKVSQTLSQIKQKKPMAQVCLLGICW